MVNAIRKRISGQSFLEAAIVFMLGLLLFGGIYKMWIWGNNHVLRRSVMYNLSRKAAGKKPAGNYEMLWPIYNSTNPDIGYKAPPSRLDEDDVFLWKPAK